MHRPVRFASAGLASLVVAAALVASPATAAGRGPVSPATTPFTTAAATADLAPALRADGTFQGVPGVTGTVDTAAWTLTSDLAAGEAPRFAPAAAAPAAAVAPPSWFALGSNGSGNGAISTPDNNSGNPVVLAIAISGSKVYVGGVFQNVAGIAAADHIAMWDGVAWSALGSNGAGDGALGKPVYAIAISGSDVYAGGIFWDGANNPAADYVAKWNGSAWSALGSNGAGDGALNSFVHALAFVGSTLYVGGDFLDAGGDPTADWIAKWDGATWSGLGDNGSGGGALNGGVHALVVSGSNLYVGGWFTDAAAIPEADRVAEWNGSAWSALGSNGSSDGAIGNMMVLALAVLGSNLYVGGTFSDVAGIPEADAIAMWNGSSWSALGSNGAGDGALPYGTFVDALAVSGTDLYVGGSFADASGIPQADAVAMWNGSSWSALGSNGAGDGAIAVEFATVFAMASSGTDLYVTGDFTDVANVLAADYVAKWGAPSAPPAVVRKPDARIRLSTAAFVGDNVYNTTGASQSRTGSATRGHAITFGISIQNDGTAADRFKLKATGAATSRYTVKYYRGTTDITTKVVAGTYITSSLAPGATWLITAKVTVKSSATLGSSVTRLVTATSYASATKKDAVKLIGKRR